MMLTQQSGFVKNNELLSCSEVKSFIHHLFTFQAGFTKLGNILFEQSEATLRFFYVMAPTPRTTSNFNEYSKLGLVSCWKL